MKVTSDSSSPASLPRGRFPPGFRFHPTDEELILYYLKRKICHRRILIDAICETDVYKWDPEDLPELSKLKTGDRQWFFFSPKDRKYPNRVRSHRATEHGYWKASGKDRIITCNSRSVGVKKTLVFYKGRAPSGIRTDWVMHEYTLDEEEFRRCCSAQQDYYVLYKVFKKSGAGPKNFESYGAPFNEEEWEKDEDNDVEEILDQEKATDPVNEVIALIDNTKETPNTQFECPGNVDIEGVWLNTTGNEAPLIQALAADEEPQTGEEQDREGIMPEQNVLTHVTTTLQQHGNVQDINFEVTQPPQVVLQKEAPHVVTSLTASCPEKTQDLAGVDLLEDFLEIDDLTAGFNGEQVQKLDTQLVDCFDGLGGLDMYQDAASVFLDDDGVGGTMEGCGQAAATEPPHHVNNNAIVNPVSTFFSDFPELVVNNSQQQFYFNNEGNGVSNHHMWMPHHNHQSPHILSTSQASIQGGIPPGVNYNNNYLMPGTVQNTRQDDDPAVTNSSFSAALWAFLESIPTTPASASEKAMVINTSTTFERMTSFARLKRKNGKSVNVLVAAGTTTTTTTTTITTTKRNPRGSGGFLCFSLLGLLCAMLWLFFAPSFDGVALLS
ncbi:unnamed protein product [Cuscuta campestris]|uniref:NAC domain-containing protein n=1 Tax=Cuscuta campestris TaxID=132261 RepID=A0A484NG47_9ASTE|nr:unnamed protein product [Cuscuta campestris]